MWWPLKIVWHNPCSHLLPWGLFFLFLVQIIEMVLHLGLFLNNPSHLSSTLLPDGSSLTQARSSHTSFKLCTGYWLPSDWSPNSQTRCSMFNKDRSLKFCLNLENVIGRVTSSCCVFFVCFAFKGREWNLSLEIPFVQRDNSVSHF